MSSDPKDELAILLEKTSQMLNLSQITTGEALVTGMIFGALLHNQHIQDVMLVEPVRDLGGTYRAEIQVTMLHSLKKFTLTVTEDDKDV